MFEYLNESTSRTSPLLIRFLLHFPEEDFFYTNSRVGNLFIEFMSWPIDKRLFRFEFSLDFGIFVKWLFTDIHRWLFMWCLLFVVLWNVWLTDKHSNKLLYYQIIQYNVDVLMINYLFGWGIRWSAYNDLYHFTEAQYLFHENATYFTSEACS